MRAVRLFSVLSLLIASIWSVADAAPACDHAESAGHERGMAMMPGAPSDAMASRHGLMGGDASGDSGESHGDCGEGCCDGACLCDGVATATAAVLPDGGTPFIRFASRAPAAIDEAGSAVTAPLDGPPPRLL